MHVTPLSQQNKEWNVRNAVRKRNLKKDYWKLKKKNKGNNKKKKASTNITDDIAEYILIRALDKNIGVLGVRFECVLPCHRK